MCPLITAYTAVILLLVTCFCCPLGLQAQEASDDKEFEEIIPAQNEAIQKGLEYLARTTCGSRRTYR